MSAKPQASKQASKSKAEPVVLPETGLRPLQNELIDVLQKHKGYGMHPIGISAVLFGLGMEISRELFESDDEWREFWMDAAKTARLSWDEGETDGEETTPAS